MAHWASGVGRLPCDECQAAFKPNRWDTLEDKLRKAGGSPCDTCRPELLQGNDDAWAVYQRCQGQLIMSMEGPVDINMLAVLEVIDRTGIEDDMGTLEKVQTIAWKVIEERSKKPGDSPGAGAG